MSLEISTETTFLLDMVNIIYGPELLLNGDFSAWTGDNPDDWTLTPGEDGSNYITEDSGKCKLVSDGTHIQIAQVILTIGLQYLAIIDITDVTAGGIKFGDVGVQQLADSTGSKEFLFTATDTDFLVKRNIGATNVTFDNASVRRKF